MGAPTSVTELLIKWRDGDRAALDQLLPLVYRELRRLARYYLSQERPDHTLQATALVHEAYLRLVGEQGANWQNRAHFFAIAAARMRQILVDHARSRYAAKRGGGEYLLLSLSEVDPPAKERDIKLLALDDALQRLEAFDSQKVRLVELRYFGGLTIEETAEVLKISPATVKRDWSLARAWLRTEITEIQS
jgi:RNA polymerase sigma factor (TIGR02999 family)